MIIKNAISSALLILYTSTLLPGCGDPASQPPATTEKTAPNPRIDSIVNAIKTDTTYKVKAASVDNGILRIAVANPDPDVVGHFNIHYDLHVTRVIVISEDRSVMKANGITGIAVYTDEISNSKLYKDLIWENPTQ